MILSVNERSFMAKRSAVIHQKNTLTVTDLHASIEGKEILHGISLTIQPGRVHVVMGPNGSGKSTLAYVLMGHPNYVVTRPESRIAIGDTVLTDVPSDQRAKNGLYLAFQAPIAIPGVSVMNLLRTAYQQLHAVKEVSQKDAVHNPVLSRRWQADGMTLTEFIAMVKQYAKILHIDGAFLERSIHDGFSGGEKKKIEMLQALVLRPKFAIFDEIDTGLDVDALRLVGEGIRLLKKNGTGVVVITHYQRILRYIRPDVVHILVNGKIVETGKRPLAREIEQSGYKKYLV